MKLNKLLITCRHPGPLAPVLGAVEYLQETMEIYLLFTDTALHILQERYPKFMDATGVTVLSIENYLQTSPTQFPLHQEEKIHRLLSALETIVKEIQPDLVLRTTPVEDIGVDEVIATAVYNCGSSAKVLCYQDEQGIGSLLREDHHSILTKGPDYFAVNDSYAQQTLQHFTGKSAQVIGFQGWKQFENEIPYKTKRKQVREHCQCTPEDKLVVFALNYSRYYLDQFYQEILTVINTINTLTRRYDRLHFVIRPHPRTEPLALKKIESFKKEFGSNIHWFPEGHQSAYLDTLCGFDLILSFYSNFNHESLYYYFLGEETVEDNDFALSMYLVDEYIKSVIAKLNFVETLSRHQETHASVIANHQNLLAQIEKSILDTAFRKTTMKRARQIIRDSMGEPDALAKFIVQLQERIS